MVERILFIIAGLAAGLLLAQSPLFGGDSPAVPAPPTPAPAQKNTPDTRNDTSPKSPEKVTNTPATSPERSSHAVTSVHDGDTLTVLKDGVQTKVRLIGINAPEIYNYQKTPQCFGTEATARAKELLTGQSVEIVTDSTQDTYDKYGRLLAYALLPDGTNFAEQMIREGFAHEYTYHLPYRYQKEFRAAQKSAQTEGRGLWKSGVCGN